MSFSNTSHPNSEKLRSFAQGLVSVNEDCDAIEHVENCPECRALVPNLERLLDRLRAASIQTRYPQDATHQDGIVPVASVGRQPTVSASTLPVATPVADPVLQVIEGRYRVRKVLGQGGMGVVYLAHDQELQVDVALKMILHPGGDTMGRFLQEARVIAQLDHVGIVKIHGSGKHDGNRYFTLEYVRGGSLHDRLRRGPLPPTEAATLVKALAEAMQVAHQRLILHRDLKPANVLLTEDGVPKITDFGLAKRLEEPGKSIAGSIMGTPSYMPPEQAQGKIHDLAPAADVYALGAVLYACLTGGPPFNGSAVTEILRKVVEEEPVPPRRARPEISKDLQTICLKCLEKQPEKRYATAEQLANDLNRWLKGYPIVARPAGRLERATKWCARNKVVTALLVVMLSLAGVLFLYLDKARESAEAREGESEQARKALEAEQERDRADRSNRRSTAERWIAEHDKARKQAFLIPQDLQGSLENLRSPDNLDVMRRSVIQFGALRWQAQNAHVQKRKALAALGAPLDAGADQDQLAWTRATNRMRSEVATSLTTMQFRETHSIQLPSFADPSEIPVVALRPDLSELALIYPGSTTLRVLGADGTKLRQHQVPAKLASLAKVETERRRKALGFRQTLSNVRTAPTRIRFVHGTIEYQVGQWLWSSESPEHLKPLPLHRVPVIPGSHWNAANDRYLALVAQGRARVTVREWADPRKIVAAWNARGGEPAAGGELIEDVTFGSDVRALFVRTNQRLIAVDADTGTAAGVALPLTDRGSYRSMIPWRQGIALVARPRGEERPLKARLHAWTVRFPDHSLRAFRSEGRIQSVSLAGKGAKERLLVGTDHHLAQAWQGKSPEWSVGIPFDRKGGGRLVVGWKLTSARGFTRSLSSSGSADDPRARRFISGEGAAPPLPYSWWGFVAAGETAKLLVEQEVAAGANQTHVRTSLFDPQEVRATFDYPTSGIGSILRASDDRRWGVVAAKATDSTLSLEAWSLADNRSLGSLLQLRKLGSSKYPPLSMSFLAAEGGANYLLISKPLLPTGAEMTVWEITPKLRRVGALVLPSPFTSAFMIPGGARAVVWRPRTMKRGPYFAEVVDLPSAKSICRLKGFDSTGNQPASLLTEDVMIYSTTQGLSDDPNDPLRIYVWDLRTGERTPLDDKPWSSVKTPEMELSPDGAHVLLNGLLHESGDAHVRIYEVKTRRLLYQHTYPYPALTYVPAIADRYCKLVLEKDPDKGEGQDLRINWKDGTVTQEPEPEVVSISRDALGETYWMLWKTTRGLAIQKGLSGQKLTLLDAPRSNSLVHWPRGGRNVLALSGDGGGLWSAKTGKRIFSFDPGEECLGFDDSNRWALVLHERKKQLRVIDLESHRTHLTAQVSEILHEALVHENRAWKLHPDGAHVAALSRGLLQIWDLKSIRRPRFIPKEGHASAVRCVAQHPETGEIATAGEKGDLLLWDPVTYSMRGAILGHRAAITALSFNASGELLASGSEVGVVNVSSCTNGESRFTEIPGGPSITGLAHHPQRAELIVATGDGRVLVLSTKPGDKLRTIMAGRVSFPNAVRCLALSADGRYAAVGGENGSVEVRALPALKLVKKWQADSSLSALAFAGTEKVIVTGGLGARLWRWDEDVPQEIVRIGSKLRRIACLAMNRETGNLALGYQDGTVLRVQLPLLHQKLKELRLPVPIIPVETWALVEPTRGRPHAPDDWRPLIQTFLKQQQWERAIWACHSYLRDHPEDAEVWAAGALAYSKMPNARAKAAEMLREALRRQERE